ncbi:MAG TPA: serine/threonine-protein kinase [Kofleriaceae bacterium]|nr:serine/threonine-protein kinase [Kofleriaceae bacterium]
MAERTGDADATEADAVDAPPTEATKREGHLHSDRGARRSDPEYMTRGTLIGRYVVVEKLGEGGMGVVYSAYDPELDRKVAIKLLQARPGGSESAGGQAWLLREAQALARLQHPNVVGVHDVGTLPGDRVFVAMELVEGKTLRKWLKAEKRSWRALVPVLVEAGKGLVAAHAAGLVHRDFKPDNVLVGDDGRVRVMDFGLARLRRGADTGPIPRVSATDLLVDAKSPLTDSLTMVGSVIGTPAYMAPEVYDGTPADAVTDQFAFGVTAFEALFGSRPFTKEQLTPPRAEVPKPKLPDHTNVPARIQRAVLRAVAIDPAQRFPSVEAFVAELQVDPMKGRKRALIAGGVLATAIGGFAISLAFKNDAPPPCTGIEDQLAEAWSPSVKEKVKAGFVATKKPLAEANYNLVAQALDRYAAEWTQTAIGSCKATRVTKNQTEAVLQLRQGCLDQRRHELKALAAVLAEPSDVLVDKADKAVFELEPVASCNDVEVLAAPGDPPKDVVPKLEKLGEMLALARAQVIGEQIFPAMVSSDKALKEARTVGWPPAVAEALLVRASAMSRTGNSQEAAAMQLEATWMAIRARRDDLTASSALSAAMQVSDALGRPGEAKIYVQLAEEFAKRAGLDKRLEPRINSVRGMVAAQSGDLLGAVDAHQKSFEAAQQLLGAESPALWSDEYMYATTLTTALSYERAVGHYEHAMKLRKQTVGAEHIDIALLESNLGTCYGHLGQVDKAIAAFDRTIAIRQKLFGKNNPLLVVPLVNYADILNREHQAEKALPLIERAVALSVPLPGVEHPTYHQAATTRAEILASLGRISEARKLTEDVMAIETRLKSPTLPTTQASRAEIELAAKEYATAATYAEQSIAGFEAASGVDNPELWRPLTLLAKAKLGAGDNAAAKPLLERAVAIAAKAGLSEHDLVETKSLLASLP